MLSLFFQKSPSDISSGRAYSIPVPFRVFRSNQWHGTAPLSQSLSRIILTSDFLAPVLSADRQSNETVPVPGRSLNNFLRIERLYKALNSTTCPLIQNQYRQVLGQDCGSAFIFPPESGSRREIKKNSYRYRKNAWKVLIMVILLKLETNFI